MQVYDERAEYEPAIVLFRKCAPQKKASAHLKIAKAGFWTMIGLLVIAFVWIGFGVRS